MNKGIQLPEDLQKCQQKINDYKKAEALKKQIGKCYSTIEPHDKNFRIMRRVCLEVDKYSHASKFRVDEFTFDESDFTFKTWFITSAMSLQVENYHTLDEMTPTNFYTVLNQKMNDLSILKEFFVKEKKNESS